MRRNKILKGCPAIIFEQIVWGFIYLFTYFTIPAGGLKYTKEIFERGYFKCKAQNQICGAFKLVSFFWHIDMISSAYIAISYICHKWKNERIGPFWGRFLIGSKYLYKEKEICFGIISQMWSRLSMTSPTIIWNIISYVCFLSRSFYKVDISSLLEILIFNFNFRSGDRLKYFVEVFASVLCMFQLCFF